jgi:prepilin-type N-terminal cleavage/methylation domain-containing protein/prepilin-type processing-associated H-X9-DG protein
MHPLSMPLRRLALPEVQEARASNDRILPPTIGRGATSGRSQESAGFTLIELLVVIAILAVLMGLLLPAIMSVRESARRSQCTNNLMQISFAIKNYQATHEMLPPGVVNPSGPIKNSPQGYHVSWIVQILPYIEQRNIFSNVDFSVGVYHPNNVTVRAVLLGSFLCPSDWGTSADVGQSSFAGCHNDVEAPIAADNNGVFFLNSRVRDEDIEDGSANTIFLGEKRLRGGELGWISGTRSTLRNTGTPVNGAVLPTLKNNDPVGGFSSAHPGGANHAFGDGSVRFLRSVISPAVYRHLGNRADGQIVSGDQF